MTEYTLNEVPEIENDLKKIKVPNFKDDYERFKLALPKMVDEASKNVQYLHHHQLFKMTGYGNKKGALFKAKKIRCTNLRRSDRFRVIYQLDCNSILILEVYFKGQKESEDRNRILKYCSTVC